MKGEKRMGRNWEVESIDPIGKPIRNFYSGRVPSTTSRFAVRAVNGADRKVRRDFGVRLVITDDGTKSVYREDPSYRAGVIRIHTTKPPSERMKRGKHSKLDTVLGEKVFEAIRSME